MEIAIIGSGQMGSTLARHLAGAGHAVRIANSRGPDSLEEMAAEIGIAPVRIADAIDGAEVVFLAIPYKAVGDVAAETGAFDGKVVVDLTNYFEERDGAELNPGEEPSSVVLARQLPGARVVKSFNTIYYETLAERDRPPGPDRLAVFYAGDDPEAKEKVRELIEAIGFAAVDAGSLAETRRLQPEGPVFTKPMTASEAEGALEGADPLVDAEE
jgi:predicted dinucleotide-binding enzyme